MTRLRSGAIAVPMLVRCRAARNTAADLSQNPDAKLLSCRPLISACRTRQARHHSCRGSPARRARGYSEGGSDAGSHVIALSRKHSPTFQPRVSPQQLRLPTEQALEARFNLVGLASFGCGTNGRSALNRAFSATCILGPVPEALPQAMIERRAFSAKHTQRHIGLKSYSQPCRRRAIIKLLNELFGYENA